jgi:hypothetical protein
MHGRGNLGRFGGNNRPALSYEEKMNFFYTLSCGTEGVNTIPIGVGHIQKHVIL